MRPPKRIYNARLGRSVSHRMRSETGLKRFSNHLAQVLANAFPALSNGVSGLPDVTGAH